jgi:hypothetical protein
VSICLYLQAFTGFSGQTHKPAVQPNRYRSCPFETYPSSHVTFRMTSVAFPKSIFSELAADLPRRACRTGESITMSSKAMWMGFRSAVPVIALRSIVGLTPLLMAGFFVLSLCAPSFGANTYYVSKSSGLDSNSSAQAKSKSTPWAHLPGMASCTSNCGSYTPTAGDTFILMGCDVWGSTDLPVNWNWSGSSGNPITIGVDKTWYNTTNCPSAWNRPILNNASLTVFSPQNTLFNVASSGATSYVTVDNIEFKGLACTGSCGGIQVGIWCYNSCSNSTFSNLYLHAWNIVTDGNCVLIGYGASSASNIATTNIIDGSDATGANPAGATCNAIYPMLPAHFTNNVIHDVANGIVGHSNGSEAVEIGGNLIYHVAESNAGSHPNNIYTIPPVSGNGIYYVHDNLVHDSVGEAYYFGYGQGVETDYAWNNIWYNIANSPEGGGSTGGASFYAWNNTVVPGAGANCFQPSLQGGNSYTTVVIENTHCISTGAVAPSSWGSATAVLTTNVLMSPTTATTQGYTSSQNFTYSPTSAGDGTVGAGTNLAARCSGQLSGLCNDTTYTVIYNAAAQTATAPARTPNTRPPSGGWDAGTYEYSSVSAPAPPSGLQATVQ